MDNVPLMHKFPRLFSISLDIVVLYHKLGFGAIIDGRGSCVGEEISLCGNLVWMILYCRCWITREGKNTTDKWLWRDVESTDFSVKTAYNILLGEESAVFGDPFTEF